MSDKLDLEILLFFTEIYHALWEEEKIDDKELEEINSLLDRLEKFPPRLLEEELDRIFGQKNNGSD